MNSYFYIILVILVGGFILERWLAWLNLKNTNAPVPEELSDVYEPEQYRKSQEYKRINARFGMITSTFSFGLIMIMFLLGGFSLVNTFSYQISDHYILVSLIFFAILMFASDLLTMPFDVYDTFVIEEKFGFNKTSWKTFIGDKIKSWLLGGIIGGGIFSLIIWFFSITGSSFWIFAWIFMSAFMVFMTMFYSNLIVPLFNRQTPLEEGELRTAIEDFCRKGGFRLSNIYVIDGSKRSTKANAYFTGLGSKKRIVLYDTLINDLDKEEIVAVLAHEIGHYRKKHSLSGTIISILQTGLMLFIFSRFLMNPELSASLGVEDPNFHISLIAFVILYTPISMAIGFFMNVFSRRNEYQADRFAAENYDSKYLISALKKLTSKNLSNLTPHRLYVRFYYSHPTLLERIRAMKKLSEQK